ncbi:hypothetical protein [Streptomyces sp. NPDC051546]|uniref:hypothetical protein n=1 Tax=Streptomyces sp. NPDC051546 TaxID=3365655 RepID=UPI0037A2313E
MTYDQERAQQLPPPGTRPEIPAFVSLLAQSDRDQLTLRLQHALGTFVRSPREAVDEADTAFTDATARLTAALVERRRVIRSAHRNLGSEAETEDLRLALRQYREITLRLLRM